jgi:hypothetical protein
MYEYSEESNPLNVTLLPNIEIQQDYLPVAHPYVPRICSNRGYFFIWYGTPQTDPDLVPFVSKGEPQWVNCNNQDHIELGVALVYPYETEYIIGSVKTAGYVNTRGRVGVRNMLRRIWDDLTIMLGDKKMICPSGSYFELLHMVMNQKRIPHEAYHWKIMKQHGFKREGEFWIR